MRRFVVHGHTAPTVGEFELDNLPGGAGRMDLLARCLLASLLTSHDIRERTVIYLVLADALTVRFDGREMRSLHPDERSAAALVRSILGEADRAIGEQPVEASPGIALRKSDFATTLHRIADRGTVIHLEPDATQAIGVEPPADPVLVLSDHRPFTEADRTVLNDVSDRRLSLGPKALHTDQTITVAHHWCDTDGWSHW